MAKTDSKEVALTSPSEFKAVEILGTRPGALAELIKENIGADISAFDLPRIKVPTGGGQFWQFVTAMGPQSTPSLEGVIAHVHRSKSRWEVSYDDATETTPPDCSSFDCITGIGSPGGDCATCPFNQYESDAKGSGKACKDLADVFIITRTGIMPTVVQVPRTSLKSLKKYGIAIMDAGLSIHDVLTKLTLHTEKKAGKDTAIIDFTSSGPIPDEMKAFVRAYKNDIVALLEKSRPAMEKQVEPDTRPTDDGAAPTFS